MNAFEIITFGVTGAAIVLATTSYFRPSHALDELGKTHVSFDHPEDCPPEQRPDEDAADAPIPVRPLRPWPFS